MSWLEDKIKQWEASEDPGWLKAQLEVLAKEFSAMEEVNSALLSQIEKLERERDEARREVFMECINVAENAEPNPSHEDQRALKVIVKALRAACEKGEEG